MESRKKPAILLLDDDPRHQDLYEDELPEILDTEKYDVLAPIITKAEGEGWQRAFFLDSQLIEDAQDLIYKNRSRINLVLADAQLKMRSPSEILGTKNLRYFRKQQIPFILWSLGFDMFWVKAASLSDKKRLLSQQSEIDGDLNYVDCLQKSPETTDEEIKSVIEKYIVY